MLNLWMAIACVWHATVITGWDMLEIKIIDVVIDYENQWVCFTMIH
jgi:hypothetical protein